VILRSGSAKTLSMHGQQTLLVGDWNPGGYLHGRRNGSCRFYLSGAYQGSECQQRLLRCRPQISRNGLELYFNFHMQPIAGECSSNLWVSEQSTPEDLWSVPVIATSSLLDPTTLRFLQLTQIRDHTLPRPSLGTVGFDQRPVGMSFSIFSFVARPYKHAPIVET
jgi:hypothetical protein